MTDDLLTCGVQIFFSFFFFTFFPYLCPGGGGIFSCTSSPSLSLCLEGLEAGVGMCIYVYVYFKCLLMLLKKRS